MNELSFVYSGEVKFKYIINGKLFESTYKNAGLPYLMKMFAMAITGNQLRDADIPCFLDLSHLYQNIYWIDASLWLSS